MAERKRKHQTAPSALQLLGRQGRKSASQSPQRVRSQAQDIGDLLLSTPGDPFLLAADAPQPTQRLQRMVSHDRRRSAAQQAQRRSKTFSAASMAAAVAQNNSGLPPARISSRAHQRSGNRQTITLQKPRQPAPILNSASRQTTPRSRGATLPPAPRGRAPAPPLSASRNSLPNGLALPSQPAPTLPRPSSSSRERPSSREPPWVPQPGSTPFDAPLNPFEDPVPASEFVVPYQSSREQQQEQALEQQRQLIQEQQKLIAAANEERKKMAKAQNDLKEQNRALEKRQRELKQQQEKMKTQPSSPATTRTTQPATFENEIPFSELKLDKRIGIGAFAEVYAGSWRGTDVAIKRIIMHEHPRPAVLEEFRSETRMLRTLRHPNIILFMASCTQPPNLCIVTERLQGSLFDLLHNSKIELSWGQRLNIALDTAKGMLFLHLNTVPIIHRDLKSPNVLLDSKRRCKVCDFGMARMRAVNTMTGQCGTFQWMAPEVIASNRYTEKADVFSFGIILWELVARKVPYRDMNSAQVSVAVLTQGYRPPIPQHCPMDYARLMQQCWHQTAQARPAFPEIVEALKVMLASARPDRRRGQSGSARKTSNV